MMMIIMMMIIR